MNSKIQSFEDLLGPAAPSPGKVERTLFEVLSILQAVYLAMDSNDVPETMWGGYYNRQDALNVAIAKLIEVMPDVERL